MAGNEKGRAEVEILSEIEICNRTYVKRESMTSAQSPTSDSPPIFSSLPQMQRRSWKKRLLAFSRKEWTGRRSPLLASSTKSVSVPLKMIEARSVERLFKKGFAMIAGPEETGFKVETFL